MGLVTEILTLPLAPARVAFWTIGQVVDAAEREYYSPAAVHRALAELSRQYDGGLISAEEFDVREDELLDRLEHRSSTPGARRDGSTSPQAVEARHRHLTGTPAEGEQRGRS